jgi:hypothetical protein
VEINFKTYLAHQLNIVTIAFKKRRSSLIVLVMAAIVCLVTQCIDENPGGTTAGLQPATSTFAQFAGSEACGGCHKNIYDKHLNTAHFLTSRPAMKKYIRGSFMADSNSYSFNPNVLVKMETRNDSFFQVAYIDGFARRAESFDIVIGSSVKGQSYLHWTGSTLSQLPISWFEPTSEWSNSPGYAPDLLFDKPITSRCLECHATYAHRISNENARPELFHPKEIVYGVDCEKCHGAAAKHVQFHRENPSDTSAKFIINPASLSRQQNLDLCALCHGGKITKTKPSFTWTVGQNLRDYFSIDTAGSDARSIDVHGNQFGLMAGSKCFKESNLTCNSCHNPHENEKGNLEVFSSRCMNCHKTGHEKVCKLTETAGAVISKNCIDCHMPRQASRSIAMLLQGDSIPTPVKMRTHLVKPYPDETKKVLDFINSQTNKKG